MTFERPRPVSLNPYALIARDLKSELKSKVPFPAGEIFPSPRRTHRIIDNPLSLLLEGYEKYGPVFTMRILASNVVIALGPRANHDILVTQASNFTWRDSAMANLIPVLGDGLLTSDGAFHRAMRRAMLPKFHRTHIEESFQTMLDETLAEIDSWDVSQPVDVYDASRRTTLRVALKALLGIDPDRPSVQKIKIEDLYESALSFYSRPMPVQLLRGPGTPWRKMLAARSELDSMIKAEISSRRAGLTSGSDVLSLLVELTEDDGSPIDSQLICDQLMTILFASHDTSTSAVTFLLYELANHPEWQEKVRAEILAKQPSEHVEPAMFAGAGEALPLLEQAIDETLRIYPPAWFGPRRSVEPCEIAGVTVPGNTAVMYSSWASHHLPDVWDEPAEFRPDRFEVSAKKQMAKSQYIPYGGGSRTCIGMRFAQQEIRLIASQILSRFELRSVTGYELQTTQQPTISPIGGMPLVLTRIN